MNIPFQFNQSSVFLYPFVLSSLVLRVRGSRAQVHQELREREEVEKELGLVKGWIQDTRGLLLSPTADLDSLLQELEVGTHTHLTNKDKSKLLRTLVNAVSYHKHNVISSQSCDVVRVVDCTWRGHQQASECGAHDRAAAVQVPGSPGWAAL